MLKTLNKSVTGANSMKEKNSVFKETVVYNGSGFAVNLYDAVLITWIMFVYIPPDGTGKTQYVSMAAFGIVMALGRIVDAVTDPIIGFWSDNTKSKWGRRKPFIFIGAPILFVSFVLAWLPPFQGISVWNAVYLGVILFIYYWAYTAVVVPWLSYLPELRPDNAGRIRIATVGVVLGTTGAMIGGGGSGPLMNEMGVLPMALILGALAFFGSEATLFAMKEKPGTINQAESLSAKDFKKVIVEVFTNRQVISFAMMIILVQSTYQLVMMNIPYFATLILGTNETGASYLIAKIIISMTVSMPFWNWIMNKFTKAFMMRLISLWMAIGFFIAYFMTSIPVLSIDTRATIIFIFTAIPIGGMFANVLGLLADLTDYDEIKSGQRREAIYYGIYGIVRKAGWALCSFVTIWSYDTFGFSVENPHGVQVVWLICAVASLLSFLAFIPYRVGNTMEETRALLEKGSLT
jgi:GPH family glycoside/pentoside/hexuronide:cation symporter